MSVRDYEYDYMPSNFSKRYRAEELLEKFFKSCEEITKKARNSVEHELDILYADSNQTKYDIYGTNLPKDSPIFIFIHGGYWQEFSKDLSAFVVQNFVAHGIKVIVGGYDLCPNVRLGDIVQQIKTFTEKILCMAHSLGSKGVWVAGHSAGAHLAACLLHDDTWLELMVRHGYRSLLKGLVLIGGVYALEPLIHVSVNEALKLTQEEINTYTLAPLGESHKKKPMKNTIHDLKVLVTVGECDSPIFIEESRRYASTLMNFVDNVEFLLLRDNIDHFDIVENLTNNEFLLSKVLLNNIKNSIEK